MGGVSCRFEAFREFMLCIAVDSSEKCGAPGCLFSECGAMVFCEF